MIILLLLLTAALQQTVRCLISYTKSESNYDKFDHFSGQYCYDKRVVVIPVNTTKNRMVYEKKTETCWLCLSWDHPFKRVIHYQRIKPVITVENVTRTTLGGF